MNVQIITWINNATFRATILPNRLQIWALKIRYPIFFMKCLLNFMLFILAYLLCPGRILMNYISHCKILNLLLVIRTTNDEVFAGPKQNLLVQILCHQNIYFKSSSPFSAANAHLSRLVQYTRGDDFSEICQGGFSKCKHFTKEIICLLDCFEISLINQQKLQSN